MSKQATPGFIDQLEPGSTNRTLLLLHGTAAMRKTFSRSPHVATSSVHFACGFTVRSSPAGRREAVGEAIYDYCEQLHRTHSFRRDPPVFHAQTGPNGGVSNRYNEPHVPSKQ